MKAKVITMARKYYFIIPYVTAWHDFICFPVPWQEIGDEKTDQELIWTPHNGGYFLGYQRDEPHSFYGGL